MTSRERLAPTLAMVALLVLAAWAASAHLTLGFRAFTSEDARRIRIAAAPAAVSALRVFDAQGVPHALWGADASVRVWLVTFVYTRCPTVCLTLGSEFQQLQASLGQRADGVRLASLSFDRARDSPEALAAYSKRFGVDRERWLVAVPASDAALSRLLREAGVVVIDDDAGGYAHNAAIHVVTASGTLVALFDMDRHREALALARELAR